MHKTLLAFTFFGLFATAQAQMQQATAISAPTGYGQKIVAVEIEYPNPPKAVAAGQFVVENRTTTQADLHKGDNDKTIVHLSLSPDDETASVTMQPAPRAPSVERHAVLNIKQIAPLQTEDGKTIAPSQIDTAKTRHLAADDFKQFEFADNSGVVVKYNLFVPKDYDAGKAYPLVMFIHDAGATNDNVKNTLYQGNGATVWASDEWQQKHPAFVLAPQFDHAIVNDNSDDPADLDPTIRLIQSLMQQYNIDPNRIYTTGQSGGAMMSIAMNIKYPDFFAASYLVAGQWAAEKTAPMAKNRLFIFVSEDDPKAFPGQNTITDVLAQHGATVQKSVLSNGNAPMAQINREVRELLGKPGNVYYMAVRSKTLPDQVKEPNSTNKGQAHNGTWKIAYDIDAIREWLFAQRK